MKKYTILEAVLLSSTPQEADDYLDAALADTPHRQHWYALADRTLRSLEAKIADAGLRHTPHWSLDAAWRRASDFQLQLLGLTPPEDADGRQDALCLVPTAASLRPTTPAC